MFGLGFSEIIFVLVVFILLFGPDELPTIAKNSAKLYRKITNFKDELNESVNEEINDIKKIVTDNTSQPKD